MNSFLVAATHRAMIVPRFRFEGTAAAGRSGALAELGHSQIWYWPLRRLSLGSICSIGSLRIDTHERLLIHGEVTRRYRPIRAIKFGPSVEPWAVSRRVPTLRKPQP